ncbi:hypothetical protein HDU84_006057 [Entophlyctis sp. JEL0112]|nr:hypothetical protein HDU84_006057 [Entophlyctis sp. JEL0112]
MDSELKDSKELQAVADAGAGGGVAQQLPQQQPPKRRRKVSDNPEVRKRKAEQNRLAQKAFRERKDLRIKELEMRVALLSRPRFVPDTPASTVSSAPSSESLHMDILVRQIRELQDQVMVLQSENRGLRDALAAGSSPNLPPLSSIMHQSAPSAQKAFRERKDARIRELEERVAFLETELSGLANSERLAAENAALQATVNSLQAAVAEAQTQNHLLKVELRRVSDSDAAPVDSSAAAAMAAATSLSLLKPARIRIGYGPDDVHPGGGMDASSSAQSPDSEGRRSSSFLDTVL